jgi:hypothetical protein
MSRFGPPIPQGESISWEDSIMSRLISMSLIVLAVWFAAEVYSKGVDGAFGGVLSSGTEVRTDSSTTDRTADAFQRAYNKSESRVDRQLEQGAPGDGW